MSGEKVISLWLDEIGDDEPKWIISIDELDEDGGSVDTRTIREFDEDEHDEARDRAKTIAKKRGLRLVES